MTVHSHARDHAAPRRVFAMAAVFAMAVADASAQPTFVIKSSSSWLVLDVPWASTQPGTQIQQWTPTGNPNQSWFLQLSSGSLVIKSLLLWNVDPWGRPLHLVFDIPYASSQPGAILQQWTETDNPNQLWYLQAMGNGAYEIVSANSGQVLDVPAFSTQPGVQIQQWTQNNGLNQQWTFNGEAPSIAVWAWKSGPMVEIAVNGWNFPPGSSVGLTAMPLPGWGPSFSFGSFAVAADGSFSGTTGMLRHGGPSDVNTFVTILASVGGYVYAIGQVSANAFVY